MVTRLFLAKELFVHWWTLQTAFSLYQHNIFITISDLSGLQRKWQEDILEMYKEYWSNLWYACLCQLVSIKLIQMKVLHRVFVTPHRIYKRRPSLSSSCWRCSHPTGTFFYIFWKFLTIIMVIQVCLTQMPRIWLLGLVEDIAPTVDKRLLLFHARKSIAIHWKVASPPPLCFWNVWVTLTSLFTETIPKIGVVRKSLFKYVK